jgi:hypothetical protein
LGAADESSWIGVGRKILSRQVTALPRSDAGGDHAETGQQTKDRGPNKPHQHWLVRQKRYQCAGQEIDRPDSNLNPMNRGQPYFFRTHNCGPEKAPTNIGIGAMSVGVRATQNLRRTGTVGLAD